MISDPTVPLLNRREVFAALALHSRIRTSPGPSPKDQVEMAVRYADLLLERLSAS